MTVDQQVLIAWERWSGSVMLRALDDEGSPLTF